MSESTVTFSSSWCPTPESIAAFHKQANQVLTPTGEQLHLPLPRYHFEFNEAVRDQEHRWQNREQKRDLEEMEKEDAAENERQWREAMRDKKYNVTRELEADEWDSEYARQKGGEL